MLPPFYMESIETLNLRLADHFGVETTSSRPMFRIVWAPDQLEKRLVNESEVGVQYLYPRIEEVKKYRYMKNMYVLEQLVLVPEINSSELLGATTSYEPLWAYCNSKREPLIPTWDATKLVVDTVLAVKGKQSLRKYVDTQNTPEEKEKRIIKIQEELFGNETDAGDALAYQNGVVVPHNYEKKDEPCK